MKEFYRFQEYLAEHASELAYDTVDSLREEWSPGLTLSAEDITLITKISQQNCLAVLREYHAWLSQQQ